MDQLSDLVADREFMEKFPYVWVRLHPFFLRKQRAYARDNKADPHKVGLFVEFMEQVMSDLETILETSELEASKPKYKKLNIQPT